MECELIGWRRNLLQILDVLRGLFVYTFSSFSLYSFQNWEKLGVANWLDDKVVSLRIESGFPTYS